MFYLTSPNPADSFQPITAVSASDAIRQTAEWEWRGIHLEVRDTNGAVVTIPQLRDWSDASGTVKLGK